MNLYIKNKNSFFLCLLFFVTSTCSFAQKDNLLSVKQMHKDLRYFYETILKVHPNPYQVLPPEQLDIRIQELLQSIDKPLMRMDFYLKIAVLNSYFDCHTQIIPPPQEYSKFMIRALPDYFIEMRNGFFYFAHNTFLDSSLCGRKINAINHIPCEEYTMLLKPYLSFELWHPISNFLPFQAVNYWQLLHGGFQSMVIEYEKEEVVDSVIFTIDNCEKFWNLSQENRTKCHPFDFKIYKDDGIALLELNTFDSYTLENQSVTFSHFLHSCFDSINSSGITDLFIDISTNGGGADQHDEIFEYLIKDSTYYIGKSLTKTSIILKNFWHKNDKNEYLYYIKSAKNKRYFMTEYIWEKKSTTHTNLYKNNVYLLQSNSTASAANTILTFAKAYKKDIISIGEETTGGMTCYISSLSFEMKYSKLHFTCSIKYSEDIGAKNEFEKWHILPDVYYPIINPAKSFTLGQLKEMLQLIEQYKKETR